MNRLFARLITASPLALALLAVVVPTPALGAEAKPDGAAAGRHYDLRQTLPAGETLAANPAQAAAIERWRSTTPGLRVDRDARTGVTRSLGRAGGYLTGARQGGDIEALALEFVRQEIDLLGLDAADLDDAEVTNVVPSRATGLTHIYLRQTWDGLPVYNAQMQINIQDDGRVLSVHNQFLKGIAAAAGTSEPALSVPEAVASLTAHLKADPADLIDHSGAARLMYLPIRGGEARLVWNFQVETADSLHWYDVTVDAADGRVWTRVDWVADGGDGSSYQVYETPVESPYYSVPPTPADGRTTVAEPATVAGSPFGWHDTNGVAGAEFTTTQGNNVHAYTDTDANNTPDAGSSPSGGAGLDFLFPIDFTQPPSAYRPAAVTNLFYWNNIIHDIYELYGFDEVGGNFQEFNYSATGLGSDYVQGEAQDGSGTNNANFATPADGQNPRMQMFVGTNPAPDVDGDLDNMVITHEYGHGISNRLTGGPANVGCLGNSEQMGEGWSDFLGLTLTHKTGDTATTARAVGTYLFGQGIGGAGIRPAPYTTDMGVNSFTYGDIGSLAIPHGVGFAWATMLWEVYWALVAEHGFNPDVYAAWNTGGNNLAIQLVLDGMKLQPCSPGFVDGRDAILDADVALTGGANQCLIWGAFAKRGLGFGAAQGSSNSTADGTENFDIPSSCSFLGSAPTTQTVCAGSPAVYNLTAGSAFTPPVTLALTGNPGATTVGFSVNPIPAVPGGSVLTVGNTGAVPAGSYPMSVTGNGDVLNALALTLEVVSGVPAAPALTAPANSTSSHPVRPTFQWAAIPGASGYTLEVDDNSDFSSITYTSPVTGTSHVPTTDLPVDAHLYWRVRATNPCGVGVNSAVFNFATSAPFSFCRTPALAIPDNVPAGVNDNLVIAAAGTVTDIDVQIVATHTWVGDLKFTLSNGGAPVAFFNRPGVPSSTFGCSADNINVTVNDEGSDGNVETTCNAAPPAISGDLIGGDPASSTLLTVFDGQPMNDTWTLNASDSAGGDTGVLTSWCVLFPNSMPFLDGFEGNNTSRWSATAP